MPQITIRSRWDESRVLYTFDATDEQQASGLAMRDALEAAVQRGAYLRGANLSGAYLRGANLRGANLRGAEKLIGQRPVMIVGPIGSRCDYLTAYVTDKGLRIQAGCFFGSRDEFAAAVAKTHSANLHGREYAAALVMIDLHAELWAPAEEEVAA